MAPAIPAAADPAEVQRRAEADHRALNRVRRRQVDDVAVKRPRIGREQSHRQAAQVGRRSGSARTSVAYDACCYEEECAYERPSLCAGEYQGDGVSCDPNPCLCADFWVYPQGDPPVVLSGTTCGMGNDCELRNTEEVIVAVQISWPGTWTFSLCGSGFDTYWYFGNDCCTYYWSQDDSTECGTAGYLSTHFDPGVYYIDLEGYSGCGSYVLTISGPPEPAPGACCDDLTLACTDGLMPADCLGPHMRHAPGGTCDELSPECGNPGACCDDDTGVCVDGVYELQCTGSRFLSSALCVAFDPLCGELPVWPCPVDGWVLAPGSFSGSTSGAANDCALRGSVDNYVGVYIPWPGVWTVDLCATSPSWDTYMYLGSDCCTSTWYNDDGCPTTSALSIIQANISTPGVYIATVEAYSTTVSGAYVLTVSGPPSPGPGACCETLVGECEDDVIWQDCVGAGLRFVGDTLCAALDPPCTPCVDVELIAPGVWSGDTTGAGDNCALRAGQDITVKVTVPTDGNWRFDLCASSPGWDTYMYIGTDCCQSTWYNDDGCTTASVLSILNLTGIPAGDYYVDIEPFSVTATGPVTLSVSAYEP